MSDELKLSYEMLFSEPEAPPAGAGQQENGTSANESKVEFAGYSQQEVDQLLAEQKQKYQKAWENEKQTIRQEAYNEGFEAGKEQVLQTIEESIDTIRQAVKEGEESFKNMLDNLKPYMTALVFDLAEKIISIPIKSTKLEKKVEDEIRTMLAYLGEEAQVKVTVPEVDFELLQESLSKLNESDRMKLYSSSDLKKGEYYLETEEEKVIKDLKKILKEFRETITFGEIDLINLDD